MADDYGDLLQSLMPGNASEAQAMLAALGQQQAQQRTERSKLAAALAGQQQEASGLRNTALLASFGQNPLLANLRQTAEQQGQALDALAGRTEQRLAQNALSRLASRGLNSDPNSPEAKALQSAWKAAHPETPPEVLATLTPANMESWRKDFTTQAELAARKEGLTAAGERAKEQIKATATQGALNRGVRIAELKQMAEQFGASQATRRFLAELESEDKAKAREQSDQQHTEEQAKDFGTKYEASGLPEFYANLQKAKEIVDKHASLPGTGLIAGNIPGRWVDKDAKILRGAAQQMMLAYRKSVTGTGAGEKEQEEIARATMLMQTNDDESIRLGLKMMQDIMDAKADALKAGYKPEAVDAAIGRLKNKPSVFRGASKPSRAPAASALPKDATGAPSLDTGAQGANAPAQPPASPKERRQYSPSLNKTRVLDASGKVLRIEEGDTRRGR